MDIFSGLTDTLGLTDSGGSDNSQSYNDASGAATNAGDNAQSPGFFDQATQAASNSVSDIVSSVGSWFSGAAPTVLSRVVGVPRSTADGEIITPGSTRPPSSNPATGGKASALSLPVLGVLGFVGYYLFFRK